MLEATGIHYAPAGDGGHLAYCTLGSGSVDLLLMSGELISIDTMPDEPRYAACLDRLASFSRVICFDQRGVGLSDPVPLGAPPTVEQWALDARAVLDAAASESTIVLAATDAGMAALLLAATHPERITRLVLFNAYARSLWAPDFPWGHEPGAYESTADAVTDTSPAGGDVDLLSVLAPSVHLERPFRDWWDRAGHRGASPTVARAIWNAYSQTDARPALSAIHVPTLVLHRIGNAWTKADHGRYIADNIENSVFVLLPGADDLWWVGDTDGLIDQIEEFVTGHPALARSNRLLAAVLFTDIVGSTEQAAALGDQIWKERLDQHDDAVGRQLVRFGGRLVKTTGDGALATFDGPARAIHCARAIRDAVGRLGLELRAGLHIGEVERRGADVSGIAVHLAQRIEAVAATGEILVSRTVVDLVAGSGIEFEDRGEEELKGIPGTWKLYAVAG
ncbi:MAG TPA: adenylate/guanylate cyclase domain-containing protein [Acidimicrobiales bacterium]|nr:adenylate/guanylate cyclase domain-containing protein [Acidimicrobiales bacterium]